MNIFDLFGDSEDNDDESNINLPPFIQMFMSGPDGFQPIPMNNMDSIIKKKQTTKLCSIGCGKYILSLVNFIHNEDFSECEIFLECEYNIGYDPRIAKLVSSNEEDNSTIMDVYRFFLKTHFLNFIVARFFGISIWDSSGITMNIDHIKFSNGEIPDLEMKKIEIFITGIRPDEYIYELVNSHDMVITKNSKISKDFGGLKMMIKENKCVSYNAPLIRYILTFGFLTRDNHDFDSISLYLFYKRMVQKYIKDAINTFFPYYELSSDLTDLEEKIVHTEFEFGVDGELMTLQIVCSPAIMCAENVIFKYEFAKNFNILSANPLVVKKDREINYSLTQRSITGFIDQMFSSAKTQIINIDTFNGGSLYQYGEDYDRICPKYVICSLNRIIEIDPGVENYATFMEVPSRCDKILDYWVDDELIQVPIENDEKKSVMNIHGFINFKCTNPKEYDFNNILKEIEPEIKSLFKLTIKDFTSGKQLTRFTTKLATRTPVTPFTCYWADGMYRVALLSFDKRVIKE